MILTNMGQFMGHNPVKIWIFDIGLVDEEKVEKGKWGCFLLSDNDLHAIVDVIAIFPNHKEELYEFVNEAHEEEGHTNEIDR